MKLLKTHDVPSLHAFSFTIEYVEYFGVMTTERTERRLSEEWEIYVMKEIGTPILLGATAYRMEAGDVLLIPPYTVPYTIHRTHPVRAYRILISKATFSELYPELSNRALNRQCRLMLPKESLDEMFALCETLLTERHRRALSYILRLFDLFTTATNSYTELDEEIERYELCLPLPLKRFIYDAGNAKHDFSSAAICALQNESEEYIERLFKTYLNMTSRQYLAYMRALLAAERLLFYPSVEAVYRSLFFESETRFSTAFKTHFGTTPHRYVRSDGVVFRETL